MLLLIDNYDSFSHNLARYLRESGARVQIVRNDEIEPEAVESSEIDALVISPGPGRPDAAGVCKEAITRFPPHRPLLGVCLGHQCLIEVFGGKTVRAKRPLHGEASQVLHQGDELFHGVAQTLDVGRYHSLVSILKDSGPLVATAWSAEGEIMAVRHRTRPWFGVQFHPESVLTPSGRRIIENFVRIAELAEA